MSNSRGKNPNLDYYELRRRHEEYKSRTRAAGFEPNNTARTDASADESVDGVSTLDGENTAYRANASAAMDKVTAAADDASVNAKHASTHESVPTDTDYYEDADEDEEAADDYADDEDGAVNPNPFEPFLHFFHGVREKLTAKRDSRSAQSDSDDDEPAYDDDAEAYADGGDNTTDTAADADVAPLSRTARRKAEAAVAQSAAAEDIDDVDVQQPAKRRSLFKNRNTDIADSDDFEDDDDFDADDDEFYADADEETAGNKTGFKKFINLFVTRVDEESATDDADDESLYEDENYAGDENIDDEDAAFRKPLLADNGHVLETSHKRASAKGGSLMSDLNNNGDIGDQPLDGQESTGMTRRERRELAERRAAEEAARKAATLSAPEEPAVPDTKPVSDVVDEPTIDMAAFGSAEKADVVETTAEDIHEKATDNAAIEEPTREFIPLTPRDTEKESLDLDDDMDEDDEEDEDEAPRRGLFARLRSRRRSKDEAEDDEEDASDDEDDEDEDDGDEDVDEEGDDRPTRRLGLFSRRKHIAEQDDEEDDDSESDEEDADEFDDDEFEDEYDDDDEYEDEEQDDEYDDDEDDDDLETHSFGHSIIGFFKVILGIVIALIVLVIVLNFLYVGGNTGLLDKLHSRTGDSSAFSLLFPAYGTQTAIEEPVIPEETEVPVEMTAAPTAEATTQVPNLDDNTAAQPAGTAAVA